MVKKYEMFEGNDLGTSIRESEVAFRTNSHPCDLADYATASGSAPDTTDADNSIVAKATDAPHAVPDAEAAQRIRISGVRSLVRQNPHVPSILPNKS